MVSERDERGRFKTGYSGGPGRPRRVTENEYITATVNRVPLAKWNKIVDKAASDAVKGDRHARRFLADYLLGKPPQMLDMRLDDAALLSSILEGLSELGIDKQEFLQKMLKKIDERNG